MISGQAISWRLTAACVVALMLGIGPGCSGPGKAARRSGYARVVTPLPPAFLTGAASLLLTNNSGFSARVEMQSENSMGTHTTSAGQLLGRGAKLLYAPETKDAADAAARPGEYSFIWDVAENRGYVLSEALQGYAPVNSALHITNVESGVSRMGAQRVAGHPCEAATVTLRSADGPVSTFEVLRAMDLKGFPLRIDGGTNAIPFVLTLSKFRAEAPAENIFSPPDGFTKYPTPEAMADELAAREHNLRRKSSPFGEPLLMPEPRRY